MGEIKAAAACGRIENESCVFVSENGRAAARLALPPRRIFRAECPAAGIALQEGRDFYAEGRTLVLLRRDVPFMEYGWLFRRDIPDGLDAGEEYGITDVLLACPERLAGYQFRVTYEPAEEEAFPQTVYYPQNAAFIRKKLRRKEDVSLLIYGDSISNAANSSGEMGLPPHAAPWHEAAAARAAGISGAAVRVYNRSRSGYGTVWGASAAAEMTGKTEADALVVAFGMNDATENLSAEEYGRNIRRILAERNRTQKDCILISSVLPNPDSSRAVPRLRLAYREKLFGIARENGCALIDMTAVSEYFFRRKLYCEISGNNFNHPNDFIYKFYEDALADLLTGGEE